MKIRKIMYQSSAMKKKQWHRKNGTKDIREAREKILRGDRNVNAQMKIIARHNR